jgi:hypothetical protein
MKRSIVIVLSIALSTTPALAQFTNCTTTGNMTSCHTIPDMSQTQSQSQRSGSTPAQNILSLFRGDPKKKAGKLLAKGDCEGAIHAALSSGDMEFVGQVRAYCARRSQ